MSVDAGRIRSGPLPLLLGLLLVVLIGSAALAPGVTPGSSFLPWDTSRVLVEEGTMLRPPPGVAPEDVSMEPALFPDRAGAARLLAIPLAMQWRHPLPGLPAARVVRVHGTHGPPAHGISPIRTFLFHDHAPLPVISLVADHNDLFHPGQGIMVVGNAFMDADPRMASAYSRDPRWWKYPGNFMLRGKENERKAHLEVIGADGHLAGATTVRLRIHGQMTRGFPQHALRLLFKDPVEIQVGPGHTIRAQESMVLRAAGNDQVKAMMRDALQHRICRDLPFGVSEALTCVVYINGAYWGVHHLRARQDHHWVAQQYGLPAKDITVLEDAAQLYRGDEAQVRHFMELVHLAQNAGGHMDRISSALDVEGFLSYMAAQIILGNMDWPEQNVRYWRYTGPPMEGTHGDGRWYFLMGDSDLAMGAHAGAATDPFVRVRSSHAPLARLYRGLIKDPVNFARSLEHMEALLAGPLSTATMLDKINAMAGTMAGEMDHHTARWRKPAHRRAWEAEVEVLREYARSRPGVMQREIDKARIRGTI